jgi:hypothetical protein
MGLKQYSNDRVIWHAKCIKARRESGCGTFGHF